MTELGDFRASSLSTLVQMVANGAGITLLPRSTAEVELRRSDELVALPIQRNARRASPSRTIGLVWRTSSPRGEEFALLGNALVGAVGRDC